MVQPKILINIFRCGARLSTSKSNAVNLILRLFLFHFLHTTSSWHHESIHNNTSNKQTPPLWWWSCSPLQRCGFDGTTLPEGWAALRMFIPRPLLKDFIEFVKLRKNCQNVITKLDYQFMDLTDKGLFLMSVKIRSNWIYSSEYQHWKRKMFFWQSLN